MSNNGKDSMVLALKRKEDQWIPSFDKGTKSCKETRDNLLKAVLEKLDVHLQKSEFQSLSSSLQVNSK